jgi:hypothetical protein
MSDIPASHLHFSDGGRVLPTCMPYLFTHESLKIFMKARATALVSQSLGRTNPATSALYLHWSVDTRSGVMGWTPSLILKDECSRFPLVGVAKSKSDACSLSV